MTFNILTVGDGDLSLSLALARAYQYSSCDSRLLDLPEQVQVQAQVQVTASTLLPCEANLIETYPQSAPDNLQELRERNCEVLFNIDATQLHQLELQKNGSCFDSNRTTKQQQWDCIVFYHAHLGDDDLRHQNEGAHAERHYRLLAHYLAAAASIVRPDQGRVHLCLCGTQAETWRLRDAAHAAGVCLVQEQPAQEPFHKLLSSSSQLLSQLSLSKIDQLQAYPPTPKWAASRRSRNGKAASRDWLGKYGYRHRRTHGDGAEADAKDVDLSGATHFLFAAAPANTEQTEKADIQGRLIMRGAHLAVAALDTAAPAIFECHICGMKCANPDELQAHLQAPALPDLPSQLSNGKSQMRESLSSRSSEDRPTSSSGSSKLVKIAPVHSDVAAVQSDRHVADGDTIAATATATATDDQQTVVVSTHNDGKRLRWYIQHCMSPPKRSKKTCELLVKDGHVFIDGQVAQDSGRILRTNVQVSIRIVEDSSESNLKMSSLVNAPTIRVVMSWSPSLQVVWKPVSMRTVGSFDASTLEQSFTRQSNCSYKSLSKLDTGFSGLCVLQKEENNNSNELFSIRHTFTALVHGHVPMEWIAGEVTVELPVDGMRRWRKRPRTDSENSSPPDKTTAQVRCLEQTNTDSRHVIPKLSTVTVATDSKASGLGGLICFYLRKAGYPVVGDRFAGTEYLSLPRSMRNRIKHRLSIGCTSVECHEPVHVAEETAPEKWQAKYWQEFGETSCTEPKA